MLKIGLRLGVTVLMATVLLTVLLQSVSTAAPLAQDTPQEGGGGQEYVVRVGDWLSRISQEFYGSRDAFTVIVEATNARADSDPRFDRINNPDVLRVGQRLWIPDSADEPTEAAASDTAMTGTVSSGEAVTGMVRIVAPEDGATLPPRFDVEMSAEGITIEPAGEIHEGAGHFHLLVDSDYVVPGELVPFDDNHLHFGGGQMTTTLDLEPGVHTLRLQVANGAHLAYPGELYGDTISVTVAGDEPVQPVVAFVQPQDGDVVDTPFDVEMGAEGILIEPAGEIHEGAGHFHILVDSDYVAPGELVPFDDNHLHFGGGQMTTTLELEPGPHTLRLQVANGAHQALDGPQYRDEITVTVNSPGN